jgi:hypothetical protein
MSFLTPLYLLGLSALSLPLILHLIRRTPKGSRTFSSLMFLSSSPPRLTRRRQIDNWLLLILRGLALLLLAVAFARPFSRFAAEYGTPNIEGRKIAILVDTSASMQRHGLWDQVAKQLDTVLSDVKLGDDVALYRFGNRHQVVVGFDGFAGVDMAEKVARIRVAFENLAPEWTRSNVGAALVAIADEMQQLEEGADPANDTIRQIVLLSDLQEGADVDALLSYQWPSDVGVVLPDIAPLASTNAGLHLAATTDESTGGDLRIRVRNSSSASREQFSLQWRDSSNQPVGSDAISVYVPVGESRVVRMPVPAGETSADRIVLTGDDHDFDNTLYVAPAEQEQYKVAYFGSDHEADSQGLYYYLTRAFMETPRRRVEISSFSAAEAVPEETWKSADLILVSETMPVDRAKGVREFLEHGGAVLVVVEDVEILQTLTLLLDGAVTELEEVHPEDYAMLEQIDFSHPLLTPFSDPRYNDFSKILFWGYRRMRLADESIGRVLARFDSGDPALLEFAVDGGNVWVFTAGWHPVDSYLARSSKFVPLLSGILQRSTKWSPTRAQYEVGERVDLPTRDDSTLPVLLQTPAGETQHVEAGTDQFSETNLPGIYSIAVGDTRRRFAVNVAERESRTARMSSDELRRSGVTIGVHETRTELAYKWRKQKDIELERRQKLWRWMIALAVSIVMLETWLAARLARRTKDELRWAT